MQRADLDLPEQTVVRGWLKGYAKEVLVVRQVFTNKDGSTGKLHLASSDLTCDYDAPTTTYKKRWQVEVFHKFLKSNANLAKSPTRTLRTQSNHVFLSICAAFKLECLSRKNKLSPFLPVLQASKRFAKSISMGLCKRFNGKKRVASQSGNYWGTTSMPVTVA